MNTPRNAPITTTVRDFLVSAWIDGGLADRPESAGGVSPRWTIEVHGHEYAGPGVDPVTHGSVTQVRDMLRTWAKEHPDLFA